MLIYLKHFYDGPKFFFSLFLLCLFILFFMHRSAQPAAIKNNTLKVCSDAGFLPFEMRNSSGQWEGFDVDMMQDFAYSLQAKLEMIQVNFDGIIPALLSGKCDVIAAGMTVTPSRAEVVAFSHPTFENGITIAIKNTEEAKSKYKNLQTLDKNGVKIAVKTGYTSDIYLSKNLKKAHVLRFENDSDLFLAVMQGRVNAFVSDTTYVSLIVQKNPDKLIILPTEITSEKFSIATRLQDKELIKTFNQFLDKWKKEGHYRRVYNKYFIKPAKSSPTL